MSSKGRKPVEQDEFYPTPPESVDSLICSDLMALPGGTWIEPCAGTGSLIRAVNARRSDVRWIAAELNPALDSCLRPIMRPCDQLLEYGDFLTRGWAAPMADVLCMNPPFSLTMEFIAAAMKCASWVVSLQRTNFFGSQKRAPWLREFCPDIYALPKRPSFRADGATDSIEYSWFVWPPGDRRRRTGRVAMLERVPPIALETPGE